MHKSDMAKMAINAAACAAIAGFAAVPLVAGRAGQSAEDPVLK